MGFAALDEIKNKLFSFKAFIYFKININFANY